MDRMFDEPFFGRRGMDREQNWGLPLDVAENENDYVIRASIPGINPDDLDISLTDNVLTIRGEMNQESENTGDRWVVRERRGGNFTRSISFPMAVDSERAEASCENGVLTLRLPKAETARPRRISIGGVSSSSSQRVVEGQTSKTNGGNQIGATPTGNRPASSAGWPEGQATTDVPKTESEREGIGWTEGQSTEGWEKTEPHSGGWTEGQSETWDEKTPHSGGWAEGQRGQS
jgi:HSP20 family protein